MGQDVGYSDDGEWSVYVTMGTDGSDRNEGTQQGGGTGAAMDGHRVKRSGNLADRSDGQSNHRSPARRGAEVRKDMTNQNSTNGDRRLEGKQRQQHVGGGHRVLTLLNP